jgi:hypothetical protein
MAGAVKNGPEKTALFAAPHLVCFWHKADISRLSSDVRYWG